MLRLVCLIVAVAGVMVTGAADARRRHPVDATPFSHAPCSVLDGQPCTPSYCSVFNHGPCIPEIDYPYGQNLQLTIESAPSQNQAASIKSPTTTSTPSATCSRPCGPAGRRRRQRPRVRVCRCRCASSFKRSGEIIAAPRLTYATAGVFAGYPRRLSEAINASLDACVPLKFTDGLGGALAGRPIAIRYCRQSRAGDGVGGAVRGLRIFRAPHTSSSLPGLTRQSNFFEQVIVKIVRLRGRWMRGSSPSFDG